MLRVIPSSTRFDGKTLVTGFQGIGATGYWAVKYLVDKLETKREAFIDSDLMAAVSLCQAGRLVTPYELYTLGETVFLRVEAPPSRPGEVTFFRELSEWITQVGFKEVALIGGLDVNLRTDDSTYRLVCTRKWTPSGPLVASPRLEDDRLIVGPVAILLNYFEAVDFPAFAVLSYASTERVDPRAAANAIKILSQYCSFEVDVSPLIKGAEVLESEIAKHEAATKRGVGENIYT